MRILHTMLRTGDLDRSIDFYTQVMGMKLLRRQDYPDPGLRRLWKIHPGFRRLWQ